MQDGARSKVTPQFRGRIMVAQDFISVRLNRNAASNISQCIDLVRSIKCGVDCDFRYIMVGDFLFGALTLL